MRAVVVSEHGGPEVLQVGSAELSAMGPEDVHVRITHAGVNFLDIHHRSGTYPRKLPFVPGREGAGIVLAVGSDVDHVAPGDRVGLAMHDEGTYAEEAMVPAWKVASLPDGVSSRTAAATMLQGLTAVSLVEDEARVAPGDTVLVHSAAGGTGSLIVQLARHAGARVLALASTQEKVKRALAVGAHAATTYPDSGFPSWVAEQTEGRGVDVVFDAVGGPTFLAGLDSLAARGHMVLYGRTGGPLPPVEPARLAQRCLTLTYARLRFYIGDPGSFAARSDRLLGLLAEGSIAPLDITELPLAEASRAHEALASRSSVGKHVLVTSDGQVADAR